MKESKFHSFFTGALIGVGLGLLLAPKDSNEAKEKLRETLNNLLNTITDIDIVETKNLFMKQLKAIKNNLNNLTNESEQKKLKEKLKNICDICENLEELAQEKELPRVYEAATNVKQKAQSIIKELENKKKVTRKKVLKKKITSE